MASIVLTVNNDPRWVEQLEALLASINANAPFPKVHIWAVDFPNLPDWGLIYKNIVIHQVDKPKPPSSQDMPGVMSCLRGQAVFETLLTTQGPVLYLDADSLVRGPIFPMFFNLGDDTLRVMVRPDAPAGAEVQAGVFVVGHGKKTLSFMKAYRDAVHTNRFLDEQAFLWTTYRDFCAMIRLDGLDPKYNDWHFRPDSIIWHCKSLHFNEPAYQAEYQVYLKEAKDALGRD